MRRRNDVPRTVVPATLVLEGSRISEVCAVDGEDLDFAGRRIHVPLLRTRDDGRIVRVQGIKTEAAERIIPMLPAAYDLLLDHKAMFGFGAKDPVFATRTGRRNTVDNVRRKIVDPAVIRANELLVGHRSILACTPHTLRRTFASISRSWTWATSGLGRFETVVACTLTDAFTLLSGRAVCPTNCPPSEKCLPARCVEGLEGAGTA